MQTRISRWFLVIAAVLCQGGALAQVPTDLPDVAPFTFGKAQLYPLYSVDLTWTDNLYYQSSSPLKFCVVVSDTQNDGNKVCTDGSQCQSGICQIAGTGRVATTISSLEPGFVLDVPFSSSHSRLGYVYDYRSYSPPHNSDEVNVPLPSVGNHFFVAESELKFASGGRLALRDDFQQGSLSSIQRSSENLTGSVVDYKSRDDRYRSNMAGVSLGYATGSSRSFDLSLNSQTLDFLGDANQSYFDVASFGGSLSGQHQIGPRVQLDWELAYDDSDLEQRYIGHSNDDPPIAFEYIDERSLVEQSWLLGASWLIQPGSSLAAKAGLQTTRTTGRSRVREDLPLEDFDSEDTHSVTGSLIYARTVPGGLQLGLSVVRDVYAGVYNDNSSFLENRFSGSLSNDADARLVLSGRMTYSTIYFPVAPTREDRTLDGELSMGYRLGRWGVARFSTRWAHRNSEAQPSCNAQGNCNPPPDFGFDVKTVGFTLSIGD